VSARDLGGDSLDELVDGMDPLECAACLAAGDACEFHAGWAEGWDACAAFVARAVDEHRAAELDHVDVVDGGL
jgi:hypothetical protein